MTETNNKKKFLSFKEENYIKNRRQWVGDFFKMTFNRHYIICPAGCCRDNTAETALLFQFLRYSEIQVEHYLA